METRTIQYKELMKGKKVFISGGAGVIGNALVEKLHNQGAEILVGDLKPKPSHWPRSIKYRRGDLNYITQLEIQNFAPNYFFHLAATFERSTESYEFWAENAWHNVRLSTHLMTMLKDLASIEKVIFASSYLIYDKQLYQFSAPQEKAYSLRESDPILPRNLTGAAKLNHEIELRFIDTFKRGEYKTISARIYRSYGRFSRDIISRWIRALLKGEELVVYKKEGFFDYIYAGDVAEGLVVLACTKEAEGIINLGRGRARKVSEVLEVLKMYFPDLSYREEDADIPYEASEANMERFQQITSWQPSLDIEDTIPILIANEKANLSAEVKEKAFKILVTSSARKVPLLNAVKAAAKKLGDHVKVVAGDVSEAALTRFFADQFWKMPHTKEANKVEILKYLLHNDIRAIVPTRDGELSFWASWATELATHGIKIMISSPDAVEICLDKLLFAQRLSELGFPVISTWDNIDQVESESYVVKERFGAGSRTLGLNLSKLDAKAHATKLDAPIFQPFIHGQEFSVDVYVSANGALKGVVVRSRDLVVNGESQITTIERDVALERLAGDLATTIGIRGHAVLQVLKTKQSYFIIECNSRFGGASTVSIANGLDSFYWFLLEAGGDDIADYPFVRNDAVKAQVRYSADAIF